MRTLGIVPVLALLASGCASMSKERGHKEVAELVESRIGRKTSWEQGAPEDEQVASRVSELLKAGLNRERAIELALLNSPSLQSTYEELGVSQADMVQAGLLSNPSIEGSVGFPALEGQVEYEASLVQNFLDLFVLPLRKRVAEEQFTADTLRVAHEALAVAAQVSQQFVHLQAQVQQVELRRMVVQAAQASAELAERLRRAGNTTELEAAREQARYEQEKLELARDELELIERREELNRLLGLWGPQTDWELAEKLPELPPQESPLEHLEAWAIRQRLDIDAARKQALLMSNALDLARTTRFFGLVEVGVHVHQDPDGPRLFGPTLSLELPVFDQRQALLGRLEAQQRQAERRLMALSVDARSEVRVARVRMLVARRLVEHYRKTLLPLRERVVEQAQLQYNGMQIGLFELLEAKQEQVEGYQAYIEAVRDYWVARAELERVMGGRIGSSEPQGQPPSNAGTTPAPEIQKEEERTHDHANH